MNDQQQMTAAQEAKLAELHKAVSKIEGATLFTLGFDEFDRVIVSDASSPKMFITTGGRLVR